VPSSPARLKARSPRLSSFHVLLRGSLAVVAWGSLVFATACGGNGSTFGKPGDAVDASFQPNPDASVGGHILTGNTGSDAATGNGCVPKTCTSLGYTCGMNGDGCGGALDCGSCPAGQVCGGGGKYSQCSAGSATADGDGGDSDGAATVSCVAETCQGLGVECGYAGDGCGGVLTCGTCANPEFCGGGGYNKCGGNNGLLVDGGSSTCTPTTCAVLGYTCGFAADGCGGFVNCGTCANPQFCGGGGYDQCGGNNGLSADGGQPACTPTTCGNLGYTCGVAPDGCGGVLQCGSCTNPEYCGGGGFSVCGGDNGLNVDGSVACTPLTCADLHYTCGVAGDGCGGTLNCGSCASPEFCGGAGFNLCGGNNGFNADGGVACTPLTCAALHYTCGITGDGCGGTIDCGTCTDPAYCGGGGFNTCGGNNGLNADGGVACTPLTCASLGYNCGQASDGCGGLLSCGTCTNPQYCGGGGYDTCGGNNGFTADGGVACTPKTCADLAYTCGAAGDGCGNLLQCGTCTEPQYCGGGGYDQCGPTSIPVCEAGAVTTVSGFVYDPANNLPIYNALVYVPTGAVQTPQTGVSPAVCGCTAPSAYASAYTGVDGSFTLTVPSDSNLSLVVELGKWQRVFSETITPCGPNQLGAHLTLPSTHLQGHIPLFAVDTGAVDTMECVLLKMGIDPHEFVDPALSSTDAGVPTGAGRVHLYQGAIVAGGAVIDNATPKESALTETASVINSYDVVLFPCQGGEKDYTSNNGYPNTLTNVLNFANDGGRMFATHYSYGLLYKNGTASTGFKASAKWTVGNGSWHGPFTGNIDHPASFPRGQALASWLYDSMGGLPDGGAGDAGDAGTYGQIPVEVIRNDFSSAVAPAQEWLYTTNPPDDGLTHMDIHYTFDTPFQTDGGGGTCGRVVFSDFHVEDASNDKSTGKDFPTECTTGPMTPQEKLLEFMLFDLTSCVTPPTCTPRTCAEQGLTCGPAGDGCGNELQCGTCQAPETCGGGGVAGACGYPDGGACAPQSCSSQHIACGPAGDGCGNNLECGSCPSPQTCGGGGVPGQCGYPDSGTCQAQTCANQGINCGPAGDGCGHLIQCGSCTAPLTCGGGGTPGQCGYPDAATCAPVSCATQGIQCGPAGDGCGNAIQCGSCTSPLTCGGGGVAGQCGQPDAGGCKPRSCTQQNIGCGPAGDGCGNELNCGSCTAPLTCGGGGVPGQCGAPDASSCAPISCQAQGIACGPAGDGCGNLVQCGTCPDGQTCGGGGVNGQCGAPDSGSCVPTSCSDQGIACGPTGDGCGNLLQCGSCPAGQTCGGAGVAGQCGAPPPACVPLTCQDQSISCGPAGDGCGNLLQCGTCPDGLTCGGGGKPGVCGSPTIPR